MSTFDISENINYFFINYSENHLLPILNKFFIDLNKIITEKIKKTISNNSLEIENVTTIPFKTKTEEIYNDLFDKLLIILLLELLSMVTQNQIIKNI